MSIIPALLKKNKGFIKKAALVLDKLC